MCLINDDLIACLTVGAKSTAAIIVGIRALTLDANVNCWCMCFVCV